MNIKTTSIIALLCSIYLIGNGTYYLFTGQAVPADGEFRDLKLVYDIFPKEFQGGVDFIFGLVCLLVAYFSWCKNKSKN